MSTIIFPHAADTKLGPVERFTRAVSDSGVMLWRNLRHVLRTPEMLLDVTIQPIMFVLLFGFVFGGAIAVENGSYINYLMAGIFLQTLVFATMTSGYYLALDLQKGLIDRFRSLPIAQSAVVTGRTITDLLRGSLAILIMFIVGLCIGFRPTTNVGYLLAAIGLMLLFSFAFTWISVTLGMAVRGPEAVQAALFIGVFPLTFASSAFVPVDTMPGWLQVFTMNQPLTKATDAVRGFLLGTPDYTSTWQTIAWSLGLIAIFFPIGIALYNRRTTA